MQKEIKMKMIYVARKFNQAHHLVFFKSIRRIHLTQSLVKIFMSEGQREREPSFTCWRKKTMSLHVVMPCSYVQEST